jgi:hypothetical protein
MEIEKIEFDMNSIDSVFMKNRVFKGMEFYFVKDLYLITTSTTIYLTFDKSYQSAF